MDKKIRIFIITFILIVLALIPIPTVRYVNAEDTAHAKVAAYLSDKKEDSFRGFSGFTKFNKTYTSKSFGLSKTKVIISGSLVTNYSKKILPFRAEVSVNLIDGTSRITDLSYNGEELL